MHRDNSSAELANFLKNSKEKLSFLSWFHLPLFQWKTFLLFLAVASVLLLNWLLTSKTFAIPKRITSTRERFSQAIANYKTNYAYWTAKQNNFRYSVSKALLEKNIQKTLSILKTASPEVLISFLVEKMNFSDKKLEELAIYPKETPAGFTLVLSKHEPQIWPFKIIVSLEVQIRAEANRISVVPTRLRRGSTDIALGLSWAYFGPEITKLQELEKISQHPKALLVGK